MRGSCSIRRISFAVLISCASLVATSAGAQVMPLPLGPPLARTDGPNYGPAYPPPRLARHEPPATPAATAPVSAPEAPIASTPAPAATAPVSAPEAPKVSTPATKPSNEIRRETKPKPERRHVELRRDRVEHRAISPSIFGPEPTDQRRTPRRYPQPR